MEEYELRKLVHRFMSGYTFVGNYVIDIPNATILAEADHVYSNCLYENRFETMLDESHTDFILMKQGLWSPKDQKRLKALPKQIETEKLNLYKKASVPSAQKSIRKNLESLKRQYNTLMVQKNLFYQYTVQFLAEMEREKFIFSNIILNNKYEKVDLKPILLEKVVVKAKKQDISIKKYRELARSDHWQGIWAASKLSSFRALGDEQRTLISYTQLYENVTKHPEAPSTTVIADDDMLDGWMLFIKEQHEREKKEKDFDKVSGEKSKYGEHFIMAKDQEDVQEIMAMNDARGKVIQKKIHEGAKQGAFNEYNIQEIQQDAKIRKL